MIRRLRPSLALIAAVIACQASSPATPVAPSAPVVRTLAVVVTAPAGAPVVGANVCAFTVAGAQMMREVLCGSTGLSSGSDPTIHVGLDSATSVEQIQIDWPSGLSQTLTGVAADQVLSLQEPFAPVTAPLVAGWPNGLGRGAVHAGEALSER